MSTQLLTHIQALDEQIIQKMTNAGIMEFFNPLTLLVVKTPTVKFLPLVLMICWLWAKKSPQQAQNRFILIETVFMSFLTLVVTRLLALTLPFRERPFLNHMLHFDLDVGHDLRTWSSFPSDHAVLSFVLAASIFRVSKKLGFWAFLHAIMMVCAPRFLMGVHYLTDLIAGAIIGILFIISTSHTQIHHGIVNKALKLEQVKPELFYAISMLLLLMITEMFKSIRVIVGYFFKLLAN